MGVGSATGGGCCATLTSTGTVTAGSAGKSRRARAKRNRARAAPGAAAVAPTQRQCHGSHLTFWRLLAGNDISKPNFGAFATSHRKAGVAAMHASASGQLKEGRIAKSTA